MGEYVYDAWGNHKIVTDIDGIASLNPIRYRGYYYDVETKLYYLKSRYYDPEVGRFINMDTTNYLDPNRLNGLNLYCYCYNNPVMMTDENGNLPRWLKWLIGGLFIFAGAWRGAISLYAGIGIGIWNDILKPAWNWVRSNLSGIAEALYNTQIPFFVWLSMGLNLLNLL